MKSVRPGLRQLLADRWLLGMLAAGLLLRAILALILDGQQVPRGDEINYIARATDLVATGELTTGPFVRPPAYFILLAATKVIAEQVGMAWLLLTKLLQCAVAVAVALPVYRTAQRVAGIRVARIAAGVLLFDPTLIAYTHLLWPETIFLAIVALVFDQCDGLEERSMAWQVGVGLLAGLAILLKPVFGLFMLLLTLWWAVRLGLRPALRLALVVGLAAALPVAPWAIRNQILYGPSIVLENQGPYNLWIGNDPRPAKTVLDQWRALGDPVVRSRVATARGLAAIREDPGRFATNSAVRALNLWGLEFFVLRLAIIGEYGDLSRGNLLLVFWILQVAYAAKLLAVAAGLGRASRDSLLRLILIYMLVFTGIVAGMVATTRFRVPFAFILSITAAIGIDRILSRGMSWRAWVAVAAAVGVLGLSLARPVFQKLAFGDFVAVEELDVMEWRFFRY